MFNMPQYENEQQWKRRIEAWLMQLDVDVKRIWCCVPQTVDQIGSFPINPRVFQQSSSSSSESESGGSGTSSSEDTCPQCVAVTISGMTGDCVLANGTWNIPHNVGCDLGSPHYALSNEPLDVESGESPKTLSIFADYSKDQERWSVYWDLYRNPGHSYGSYVSEIGLGLDWGGGSLTRETGCVGSVSMTPQAECPESSSSSSSESSSSESSTSDDSSSSGESSSGESSSGETSSGSPSCSEEESSSGGDSSGESSGDSSGASSGESSGESSDESGGYDPSSGCDGDVVAAAWTWSGGNWILNFANPSLCGNPECTTPLLFTPPPDEGYPGLIAYRQCDGDVTYSE